MSNTKLELYYEADCHYCQIAVSSLDRLGLDCTLLPKRAHEKVVEELGDGSVPILINGDEVVLGSQSIVSYLTVNFADHLKSVATIGKPEVVYKKGNIGNLDFTIRFLLGSMMSIFGYIATMDARPAFDPNVDHAFSEAAIAVMGTLPPVLGYTISAIGLVIFYTSLTRNCFVYSKYGWNTNTGRESAKKIES